MAANIVDISKTTIRSLNSSHSSKLTKAAKKLFTTQEPNDRIKSKSSDTDSLSGDLLADAPTGPTFDWTQEQTIAYLDLCKNYSKELAPKRNALEVKPSVWEQLAKELNTKGMLPNVLSFRVLCFEFREIHRKSAEFFP